MDSLEVLVAHSERATVRVGDTFLKIDADQARLDVEVAAMRLVPVPTATVLWRQGPVVAFDRLPGRPLGTLGEPSSCSAAAWRAAGAAVRKVHDAPLPPWQEPTVADTLADLERECAWLMANGALPAAVVERNREVASAVFREFDPVFVHGDLQLCHIFVDENDAVTGILDWSEAAAGDPVRDIAKLTLGHPEQLGNVLAGYGDGVDQAVVRGWWSLGSLLAGRWLIEHGYDPDTPGCEFDVLRAAM